MCFSCSVTKTGETCCHHCYHVECYTCALSSRERVYHSIFFFGWPDVYHRESTSRGHLLSSELRMAARATISNNRIFKIFFFHAHRPFSPDSAKNPTVSLSFETVDWSSQHSGPEECQRNRWTFSSALSQFSISPLFGCHQLCFIERDRHPAVTLREFRLEMCEKESGPHESAFSAIHLCRIHFDRQNENKFCEFIQAAYKNSVGRGSNKKTARSGGRTKNLNYFSIVFLNE